MILVSTPNAVELQSHDSLAVMGINDGRRLAGTTALKVPWAMAIGEFSNPCAYDFSSFSSLCT